MATDRDNCGYGEAQRHSDARFLDTPQMVCPVIYSHSLSGADLGLQHATRLWPPVLGSCVTKYGWLTGETEDESEHRIASRRWGKAPVKSDIDCRTEGWGVVGVCAAEFTESRGSGSCACYYRSHQSYAYTLSPLYSQAICPPAARTHSRDTQRSG